MLEVILALEGGGGERGSNLLYRAESVFRPALLSSERLPELGWGGPKSQSAIHTLASTSTLHSSNPSTSKHQNSRK